VNCQLRNIYWLTGILGGMLVGLALEAVAR